MQTWGMGIFIIIIIITNISSSVASHHKKQDCVRELKWLKVEEEEQGACPSN